MNARPPRPNPAIYPRMYARLGTLLHRATRLAPGEYRALCQRHPFLGLIAVEGQERAPHLGLVGFIPAFADRMKVCDTCNRKAGLFA